MKKRERFFLVREDALSESMVKVLEAKNLLERGKVSTIKEAVEQVGLSRSAFYKYKDGIFPFHQVVKEQIVTLYCYLEDQPGTLTKLLDKLSQNKGNVLTIHQTIPLQGRANVSLSIDTSMLTIELDDLIQELELIEEVEKVDVVATGGL